MEFRTDIRFILDGKIVTVTGVDPTRTVLQYLREDRVYTGTKEGCAEGDCGACTVVLVELVDDRLRYRAVNACIQFLPTLDGKALFTVESLSRPGEPPHPVQQAMVECHGSQCGFCTPGFVMSLFALYQSEERPDRRRIDDCLAGNLCRCTGYKPIVDAAARMFDLADATPRDDEALAEMLRAIRPDSAVSFDHDDKRYFAPVSLDQLERISCSHPDACLLAGGTDVGLWVTKQHRRLDTVVYVGNVRPLWTIESNDDHFDIGSAVTLTDAIPVILGDYPELSDLFRRFASPPIRNTGTLGGNIANGSPIGDSMPALITIGTRVILNRGGDTRELSLEDFYIDYQKTALQPGEFLQTVRVPRRAPGCELASYKISKRFDQDISAICGAFSLHRDNEKVTHIRVAYGGVAAIPKRAFACEQSLLGRQWNESAVTDGMDALNEDYAPISDMRASAGYRRTIVRNLLYKFYLQTVDASGEPVDMYNHGR